MGILVRHVSGGGGRGWVGPLLKQCSYATYDANKLSVRAGGGRVVTARPGLAKLQREGRVDPAS